MKLEIEKVLDEFDNIAENDDASIVDFVNKHYFHLINFQIKNITETEDISVILTDYFSSLYQLARYTTIIEKRDDVLNFIEQLRDNSNIFNDCYTGVEYVFSEAISISKKDFKGAIYSLNKIHELDPKNENIIIAIRSAKFNQRRKIYQKIIWTGLIIALAGLVGRLFSYKNIFWIIDTLGFVIFAVVLLIQYLDGYITDKRPSH